MGGAGQQGLCQSAEALYGTVDRRMRVGADIHHGCSGKPSQLHAQDAVAILTGPLASHIAELDGNMDDAITALHQAKLKTAACMLSQRKRCVAPRVWNRMSISLLSFHVVLDVDTDSRVMAGPRKLD